MSVNSFLSNNKTKVVGSIILIVNFIQGYPGMKERMSEDFYFWFMFVMGLAVLVCGFLNTAQAKEEAKNELRDEQGGYAQIVFLVFILGFASLLYACANSPVSKAETFEQKAYALYGTYVIYQGRAAQLHQDSAVPQGAKAALSRADAIAYPVSITLIDAAMVVSDTRELLETCQTPTPEITEKCKNTSDQQLAIAITNLSSIYLNAKPKLLAVKEAFDVAKKSGAR